MFLYLNHINHLIRKYFIKNGLDGLDKPMFISCGNRVTVANIFYLLKISKLMKFTSNHKKRGRLLWSYQINDHVFYHHEKTAFLWPASFIPLIITHGAGGLTLSIRF